MKKITITFMVSILFFMLYTMGIAQDNIILDTKYYPPSGESGNVAIMFFGGSDGGFPNRNVEPFTAKGYPCLMVGYFGTKNTPDHLEMIPLVTECLDIMYLNPPKKLICFIGGLRLKINTMKNRFNNLDKIDKSPWLSKYTFHRQHLVTFLLR